MLPSVEVETFTLVSYDIHYLWYLKALVHLDKLAHNASAGDLLVDLDIVPSAERF